MEPDILYHYTSLDALFSIITNIDYEDESNVSFTLRATHASFLSDLNEGRLLSEALRKLGVSEVMLWSAEAIQGYPFVLSLSELNDNLNMWRCYADNGKGVSIGLDKSILEELHYNPNEGKLVKCDYVTKEKLIDKLKDKDIDKIQENDFKPLDRLMRNDLLTYKDESFHAEKEWRISIFFFFSNYRINNKEGLIIPYVEIRPPVAAIKTITIGPKSDFERNKFAISRFLRSKIPSCDLSRIRILKSSIPLT